MLEVLALIIPALALVGAGVAAFFGLRSGPADDVPTGGAVPPFPGGGDDPSDPAPPVAPPVAAPPVTGSEWTTELDAARGAMPLGFLIRWMLHESDGNPCATGMMMPDGSPRECGLGQLDFGDSPDGLVFGATRAELRAACDGSSQRVTRALTAEERDAQVRSLVAMAGAFVVRAGQVLQVAGVSWGEDDILCLAKLQHALPILLNTYAKAATAAGRFSSWDSFRSYLGMDRESAVAIDRAYGYGAGQGGAPYWPFDRLAANAQYTGRGT